MSAAYLDHFYTNPKEVKYVANYRTLGCDRDGEASVGGTVQEG